MAEERKVFSVIELKRESSGRFVETSVRFDWDAKSQSAPRNSWPYGVKQRTVRQEYIGTELPSEQVLGPSYKPFELEGMWSDVHAGSGFAEATRVAFEALVKRGNRVRLTHDAITVDGIITDFDVTYRRKREVGWRFTFSPHTRATEGTFDEDDLEVARKTTDPQRQYDEAAERVQTIVEIQTAAPSHLFAGTLYSQAGAKIDALITRTATVQSVVTARVLSSNESAESSLARLQQSFVSLRQAAEEVPELFRSTSAAGATAFESATAELAFETWQRGMVAESRALALVAWRASSELSERVRTNLLALYRPHSNESLYAISLRFYGTPHRWRDIAARNHLATVTGELTGRELLEIPAVTALEA